MILSTRLNLTKFEIGNPTMSFMQHSCRIRISYSNRMPNFSRTSIGKKLRSHRTCSLFSFGSLSDMLQCKKLVVEHIEMGQIQEVVMPVFIWVVRKFRNERLQSNQNKSNSYLANNIQALSHLWINPINKSEKIRWMEWCCNSVIESNK